MYSGTSILWSPSGQQFMAVMYVRGGCTTRGPLCISNVYVGTHQGGLYREVTATLRDLIPSLNLGHDTCLHVVFFL